ncbi:MAG: DNA polymerase I, partial [Acidimicrobiia bacterium]|nr:DNA polymerase I [Acidimicrobiia bacterium]NNL27105.1 DNA polymerase I [Acidimicrobiia bacterium]
MPTLAILDGHSLAYRAFYALPSDLATPAGQVTNAVYGFTSMIIRLLGDEAPDALAVAWDTPARTFRSDLYPEYKAQRESAPDLFRSQLPLMREVASALQIRQFELEGYEADDLIATVASEASSEGWDVLVVTGDRDAFQLIEDRVTVLYTRRGITDVVRADAAYVEERYGIGPDAYPQYAALRGDSSDNLPGVPGVGEKTATRLLQEHGSLDGIFQHLDQASPKLAESLAKHRDQVYLNLQLTRLDRSVPITWELEELRRTEWDQAEVKRVFDGLAFQSLWTRLVELGGGSAGPAGEVLDTEVVPLRDLGELPDSGPLVVEPY